MTASIGSDVLFRLLPDLHVASNKSSKPYSCSQPWPENNFGLLSLESSGSMDGNGIGDPMWCGHLSFVCEQWLQG